MTNEEAAKECNKLVSEFFKDTPEKIELWFNIENPMLGNVSANKMIEVGRAEKLLKIIKNMLEGNMA